MSGDMLAHMISSRKPDRWYCQLVLRRPYVWLCALTICLFSLRAPAAIPAAEYHLRTWTVENGLPQNVIRGIAQTPDGYLWIATLDGLARFDGVRFTTFNKSNTRGIASNRFSGMVQDRNGDLWLTTESGGLTRYRGGSFRSFGPEDGIPADSVRGILRASTSGIWVLSEESILKFNPQTSEFMDVTPAGAKVRYRPLQWDGGGGWAQDNTGLHLFIDGRFISYTLPAWISGKLLWGVGIDQSGTLWLETADGRQGVIAPNTQAVKPVDASKPQVTSYLDSRGRHWSQRVSSRLSRLLEIESAGHIATIAMTRFFEDREGNIWVGTEGEGLYQIQEKTVTVYSKAQGLIDQDIYPIYQDQAGTIWIGAWQKGLSSFRDGRFTN